MRKIASALCSSVVLARLSCKHQLPRATASGFCTELAVKCLKSVFPLAEQLLERALTEVDTGNSYTARLCSANLLGLQRKGLLLPIVHQGCFRQLLPWVELFLFCRPGAMYLYGCHRTHTKRDVLSFPYILGLHLSIVRMQKKELRERAAHMLAISSVSFINYVEEELEGKVSGWDWGSRLNPIWVHNLGSKVDWLMILLLR